MWWAFNLGVSRRFFKREEPLSFVFRKHTGTFLNEYFIIPYFLFSSLHTSLCWVSQGTFYTGHPRCHLETLANSPGALEDCRTDYISCNTNMSGSSQHLSPVFCLTVLLLSLLPSFLTTGLSSWCSCYCPCPLRWFEWECLSLTPSTWTFGGTIWGGSWNL